MHRQGVMQCYILLHFWPFSESVLQQLVLSVKKTKKDSLCSYVQLEGLKRFNHNFTADDCSEIQLSALLGIFKFENFGKTIQSIISKPCRTEDNDIVCLCSFFLLHVGKNKKKNQHLPLIL